MKTEEEIEKWEEEQLKEIRKRLKKDAPKILLEAFEFNGKLFDLINEYKRKTDVTLMIGILEGAKMDLKRTADEIANKRAFKKFMKFLQSGEVEYIG